MHAARVIHNSQTEFGDLVEETTPATLIPAYNAKPSPLRIEAGPTKRNPPRVQREYERQIASHRSTEGMIPTAFSHTPSWSYAVEPDPPGLAWVDWLYWSTCVVVVGLILGVFGAIGAELLQRLV